MGRPLASCLNGFSHQALNQWTAVPRTDDPAQEDPVLAGYIVDNAHAVGRRPDRRTVLEVMLGDAVLDQLGSFGAYDEGGCEDGDA